LDGGIAIRTITAISANAAKTSKSRPRLTYQPGIAAWTASSAARTRGRAASAADGVAANVATSRLPRELSTHSSDTPARLPHPDEIMDLKPLGQVSSSFIVAVNGEGLWIVDQHVAHERVLFEQHLEARRAGKVESQRMLMPMILELSPRQLVIYEKIAAEEKLSAHKLTAIETHGERYSRRL